MSKDFSDIKKNLKKDFSAFPEIRTAVMADSASQLFCQALRGYGYLQQLNINIWEADYDRIYESVMDPESELYEFKPSVVIIFQSSRKLLSKFNKGDSADRAGFADEHIRKLESLIHAINSKITCNIVYLNFAEINDQVFGNFANKLPHSFIFQLRKINFNLMQLAAATSNLNIADIATIQNQYGAEFLNSNKLYVNTDNVFDLDALVPVAQSVTNIIQAYQGRFKKCLVLDLDNTLWGGVIGDDGLERIQVGDLGIGKAFTDFQRWIKQLQERGIILTVCSKNTEHIAKEPFEKHPDMVLKLEDIAVFVANWENKVNNIRYIQSVLNIGFDAMVFLDDNPAEREVVRQQIPELCVPEMPEDPADYLSFMYGQQLFETVSYTGEDKLRTKQYREEAGRKQMQATYVDETAFLKSLQMQAVVKPVDKFSLPRAAQLTQRSNQFNLRTVRYTEEDIQKIIDDPLKFTLSITLSDKFGDYGLISLLIAEKKEHSLFIDTWIMSCRVLKRGVESLALHELEKLAKANGCSKLVGEFIPTPKNALVQEHYKKLGFTRQGNLWHMEVAKGEASEFFINTSSF